MSRGYVLDACALIAFLNDEQGAGKVQELFLRLSETSNRLLLHEINLLEIYYGVFRYGGESLADQTVSKLVDLPIKIIRGIRKNVFKEAGRLKATYKISLADSVALAEAKTRNMPLVTCDHHEFDLIERNNELRFYWIR